MVALGFEFHAAIKRKARSGRSGEGGEESLLHGTLDLSYIEGGRRKGERRSGKIIVKQVLLLLSH